MAIVSALLGILVGAVIGFVLGRVDRKLDRDQRKLDVASLLSSEVSEGKAMLDKARNLVEEVEKTGQVKRWAGPAFPRTVFANCVGDLALLPDSSRQAVLKFYLGLDHVQWVIDEMHFQEGRRPADPDTEMAESFQTVMGRLQQWFLEGSKEGLEAAQKALVELEKAKG